MKIQAYKCRFTGAIFEAKDKKKYVKHLKVLRKDMKLQREYNRSKDAFYTWLHKEKEKLSDIDMIIPWIHANQKQLMIASNTLGGDMAFSGDKWYPDTDEITITHLTVKWSERVSNSHSCPKNGVLNWGGRDTTLPSDYPGYIGSIAAKIKRLPKHMGSYPFSGLMEMIGINTGTGGGGNEGCFYQAELFIADWPGLAQSVLADKLRGVK